MKQETFVKLLLAGHEAAGCARRSRQSWLICARLSLGSWTRRSGPYRRSWRDGRRRRIERPESEWVRHTDEALRIIDDGLWARVQAQIQKRTTAMLGTVVQDEDGRDRRVRVPRSIRGGRPRHLLAGFLECAECGGSFQAMRHSRFGCSWNRDRGKEACSNTLRVDPQELEDRILRALHEKVLTADILARASAVALRELQERAADENEEADRARLAELDAQVGRLVDALAIADGVPELAHRLAALQAERDEVRARLAAVAPEVSVEELREAIEEVLHDLREVVSGPEGRQALQALLGDRRLRIAPDEGRGFLVEGVVRVGPDMLVAGARNTRVGSLPETWHRVAA